jgi:hypothetical protein
MLAEIGIGTENHMHQCHFCILCGAKMNRSKFHEKCCVIYAVVLLLKVAIVDKLMVPRHIGTYIVIAHTGGLHEFCGIYSSSRVGVAGCWR